MLSKHFRVIDEAFSKLENVLKENKPGSHVVRNHIDAKKYEEAIGVLTIEKSEVQQRLNKAIQESVEWQDACNNMQEKLDKAMRECEEWKNVCREVIRRLNLVLKP